VTIGKAGVWFGESLFAMEPPKTTSLNSIRDAQANLFRMVLSSEDVARGQFPGYRW